MNDLGAWGLENGKRRTEKGEVDNPIKDWNPG
jgi:hypothetical protein